MICEISDKDLDRSIFDTNFCMIDDNNTSFRNSF